MPFLTCTNLQPQIEERGSLYVRSDNKFQFAKMKFKSNQETEDFAWMRSFYPINIDQQTIFVGRRITGKKVINGEVGYNSIKLYLLKPPKKVAKASNAFDGSYSFRLDRFNPSEGSIDLGRGILEIKDGKISVSKKSRQLKTSSTSYYDTFEGQIDKQGNITSSFTVNALKGKGSPQPVNFSGRMNELQIKGKFDDYFEMIIQIKPLKPHISEKKPSANEKEEDKTKIESYERFATIEVSDAFDGAFSFNFTGVDEGGVLGFGYGTLNIKNGVASVSKDSQGMAKPKYQSFEGRVDKNGYLTATLIFNPCPHCADMVDKLIVFEGNLDKKKLSGMYDDIKLYFYLVKK